MSENVVTRKAVEEFAKHLGIDEIDAEVKLRERGFKIVEELPPDNDEDSIVACVTVDAPTYFDDNAIGKCAKCGVGVQYRPYISAAAVKWCLACVARETTGN